MKNRDSFRGTSIDETFANLFKKSKFYTDIYTKHKDEIIIGVRDGSVNLYYNCDSIASIKVGNPQQCKIDKFYTNGEKNSLTEDEIVSYYKTIIENSNNRKKLEKQSQQRLFIDNNKNKNSKWFCIDVEYTKSLKGERKAEDWRFDIIAISKEKPFRVALIELKYGFAAIGGNSGIRKHVEDFHKFYKDKKFEILKPELVSIIEKLGMVGVDVPSSLKGIKAEYIATEPEFYFVVLNNNPSGGRSKNTPKQTTSGYLFKDNRWGCNKISRSVKEKGDYYALIENDKSFKPVFLFSKATLPDLQIQDILDRKYYEIEIV